MTHTMFALKLGICKWT